MTLLAVVILVTNETSRNKLPHLTFKSARLKNHLNSLLEAQAVQREKDLQRLLSGRIKSQATTRQIDKPSIAVKTIDPTPGHHDVRVIVHKGR